jgi:hypothetical protein
MRGGDANSRRRQGLHGQRQSEQGDRQPATGHRTLSKEHAKAGGRNIEAKEALDRKGRARVFDEAPAPSMRRGAQGAG